MKVYRRIDGFEVHDAQDRGLDWANANFGGGLVEVPPPTTSPAEIAKAEEIAEKRAFLASTDYKVIRQIEQSTLSSQEYAELLSLRQAARDRINELEGV